MALTLSHEKGTKKFCSRKDKKQVRNVTKSHANYSRKKFYLLSVSISGLGEDF